MIDYAVLPVHLRLVFLALATLALYAALAWQSDAPALWPGHEPAFFEQSPEFLILWAALLIPYAMAVRAASRSGGRALFILIFLSSASFRTVVFLGTGFGHPAPEMFLQGATPLSLIVHHADWDLPTTRAIATLADLAALALAPGLLRAAGLPVGAAVIHGWNPLVVAEVAGNGRFEAIALLFLVAAFRLAASPRLRWTAALAYGASLSSAAVLVVSVPAMSRRLRLWVAPALVTAWAAWSLAFPDETWSERVGWPPSDFLGGSLTPTFVALARLFVTRNILWSIGIALLTWLVFSIVRSLIQNVRDENAPSTLPRDTLFLVGSWAFLSPQVAPWTFLIVSYLAAFTDNRGWIVFTATAPLTYLALAGGGFSFWLGFAQYFVAYAALIFLWLGPPLEEAHGGP